MFTLTHKVDPEVLKRFDRWMDYVEGKRDAEWQEKFNQLAGALSELDKSKAELKSAVDTNQP